MAEHNIVITDYAKIYMGGNIDTAAQTCREYCNEIGLCVRLYESHYIYTDGQEVGFCVQLINYPRFPSTTNEIYKHAKEIAERLLESCGQESYTIETPIETYWYSKRDS